MPLAAGTWQGVWQAFRARGPPRWAALRRSGAPSIPCLRRPHLCCPGTVLAWPGIARGEVTECRRGSGFRKLPGEAEPCPMLREDTGYSDAQVQRSARPQRRLATAGARLKLVGPAWCDARTKPRPGTWRRPSRVSSGLETPTCFTDTWARASRRSPGLSFGACEHILHDHDPARDWNFLNIVALFTFPVPRRTTRSSPSRPRPSSCFRAMTRSKGSRRSTTWTSTASPDPP